MANYEVNFDCQCTCTFRCTTDRIHKESEKRSRADLSPGLDLLERTLGQNIHTHM